MVMKDEITDKDAIINAIGYTKNCPITSIVKDTHLETAEVEIYVSKMTSEGLIEDDGLPQVVTLTKEGVLALNGSYQSWRKVHYSPLDELVLIVKSLVVRNKWLSVFSILLSIATIVLAVVASIDLALK